MGGADVVVVANTGEWQQHLTSPLAVVVDFTATWCGPCRMIGPYFGELATEYKGKLVFLQVDVDACADIAAECAISAMPTFQVWQGGKKVEEFCGADKGKLKQLVDKYAAK